jgi:hypothetical protein
MKHPPHLLSLIHRSGHHQADIRDPGIIRFQNTHELTLKNYGNPVAQRKISSRSSDTSRTAPPSSVA